MARNELIDETGQLLSDPVNRAIRVNVVVGGGVTSPVVQQGAKDATAQPWLTDGSGVVQPVSAATLPLPAGAATSANQATEIAGLASIDASTSASKADLDALVTRTTLGQATMAASRPVAIASDQPALPVSVASLPLPTGAALDASIATTNAAMAVARRLQEQQQLDGDYLVKLAWISRHREQVFVGDRFDNVDRRGPGGR